MLNTWSTDEITLNGPYPKYVEITLATKLNISVKSLQEQYFTGWDNVYNTHVYGSKMYNHTIHRYLYSNYLSKSTLAGEFRNLYNLIAILGSESKFQPIVSMNMYRFCYLGSVSNINAKVNNVYHIIRKLESELRSKCSVKSIKQISCKMLSSSSFSLQPQKQLMLYLKLGSKSNCRLTYNFVMSFLYNSHLYNWSMYNQSRLDYIYAYLSHITSLNVITNQIKSIISELKSNSRLEIILHSVVPVGSNLKSLSNLETVSNKKHSLLTILKTSLALMIGADNKYIVEAYLSSHSSCLAYARQKIHAGGGGRLFNTFLYNEKTYNHSDITYMYSKHVTESKLNTSIIGVFVRSAKLSSTSNLRSNLTGQYTIECILESGSSCMAEARQYLKESSNAVQVYDNYKDVIKIPTKGIISKDSFQIDMTFVTEYMTDMNRRFVICFDSGPLRNLYVSVDYENRIWVHFVNEAISYPGQNVTQGKPVRFSIKSENGRITWFVNGIKYSKEKSFEIGDHLYVGSDYEGKNQLNALISHFRILTQPMKDNDIMDMHSSFAKTPITEWTSYKLNFEDNILPSYNTVDVGVKKITDAHHNGTYWLIAGDGSHIVKYQDGTVTDLTDMFDFGENNITTLMYGGSYWLVGGENGIIKKYDGHSVSDLTEIMDFEFDITAMAWGGYYWLVAGQYGIVKRYDGTVTDMSETFGFKTSDISGFSVNSIAYDGKEFLLVAGPKAKKYDGDTVTDISDDVDAEGMIDVVYEDGYFMIGTLHGKVIKLEGEDIEQIDLFTVEPGEMSPGPVDKEITSMCYNGHYWIFTTYDAILKYDGETIEHLTYTFNLKNTTFYFHDYFLINGGNKTITFNHVPDVYTYTWISPAIDVSGAEALDSGHVHYLAQVPTGSSVSIKSRSCSSDGIWSDWHSASPEGDLGHPPDNSIQIAMQMKKRNKYKPSLDYLILSLDGKAEVEEVISNATGGQYYMDTFMDNLIIVNGVNIPQKYDGDTIENLGGSAPIGSYIATHKNRIWMTEGSRLHFSDLLDIDTWPALNFIDISPNDGDTITSLMTYGDYLIIGKNHSIWLLSGEGINTFIVKRIHSDIGVHAPRSLINVDGSLCFVANDGIYMSDLTRTVLMSERIKNYWENLNHNRLRNAASLYYDKKIYVSVPKKGSMINNSVIVFDMLRKSFVGIREGWNINCWLKFYESDRESILFGHSDKGQLSKINTGYTNDGESYEALWQSKEFDFNSPEAYKRWNKIYVNIKPANYDAELIFAFSVDGKDIGQTTVVIPKNSTKEVYSMLVLASKAGVVGGRRLALTIKQTVKDNPVGIQSVSIEHISHGERPTYYGW